MKESTPVRENLMNRKGYEPYCGNMDCQKMPRTKFTGEQFKCSYCGWESVFPEDFMKRYKDKWMIESTPKQANDPIKNMFMGIKKKEPDPLKCQLCDQDMEPRYCCEKCDDEMFHDIVGGDMQELQDLRKFFSLAENVMNKEALQRINAWYAVYRTRCPTQDEDKILHGNIVNYMREKGW